MKESVTAEGRKMLGKDGAVRCGMAGMGPLLPAPPRPPQGAGSCSWPSKPVLVGVTARNCTHTSTLQIKICDRHVGSGYESCGLERCTTPHGFKQQGSGDSPQLPRDFTGSFLLPGRVGICSFPRCQSFLLLPSNAIVDTDRLVFGGQGVSGDH